MDAFVNKMRTTRVDNLNHGEGKHRVSQSTHEDIILRFGFIYQFNEYWI